MYYYQILLEVFFYGLIGLAVLFVISDIFNHIHRHRRRIRRSLRIIKTWY